MPDFNALNAKIAALRKGLFDKETYEKLMNLQNDEDLPRFLEFNPLYKRLVASFKERFQNFDSESASPRMYMQSLYGFEHFIKQNEANVLYKLKNFAGKELSRLVSALILKYEAEDLKLIFSAFNSKTPLDLETYMLTLRKSKYIDHDRLLNSKNIYDFVKQLSKSPFAAAFAGESDFENDLKQFHLQMNLDRAIFLETNKAIDSFDPKDKKILKKYFDTLTDIVDLEWVMRAKYYYSLTSEEIYNYSLKSGRFFKGEALKNLVYAQDFSGLIRVLKRSPYKEALNHYKDPLNITNFLTAALFKKTVSGLLNYQSDISTFLRFYLEFETQNKNIIIVSQALRYDKSGYNYVNSLIVTP